MVSSVMGCLKGWFRGGAICFHATVSLEGVRTWHRYSELLFETHTTSQMLLVDLLAPYTQAPRVAIVPTSSSVRVQTSSIGFGGVVIHSQHAVGAQIAIGGHRGMGQNQLLPEESTAAGPSYRENTLGSFQQAIAAGASFVEFDVQVTQDGVPVIWHDDFVLARNQQGQLSKKLIRELSAAEFKGLQPESLLRECQVGEKPLEWRCDHEDLLPTLNEVFRGLPEHVGFDIEVKMTTPDTEAHTPPEEVCRMVTALLAEVREWGAASYWRMVFSTFDPNVALELKRRQSSIPVLFLTDGRLHYADSRRCGLSTAVSFAAQNGLDGVVLDCFALSNVPEVVAMARRLGLHVSTYGVQNDDPTWVLQQQQMGVHAAIVDDVRRVVKGITAQPKPARAGGLQEPCHLSVSTLRKE